MIQSHTTDNFKPETPNLGKHLVNFLSTPVDNPVDNRPPQIFGFVKLRSCD